MTCPMLSCMSVIFHILANLSHWYMSSPYGMLQYCISMCNGQKKLTNND